LDPVWAVRPDVLEISPTIRWVKCNGGIINRRLVKPRVVLVKLFPTEVNVNLEMLGIGISMGSSLVYLHFAKEVFIAKQGIPRTSICPNVSFLPLALLTVAFESNQDVLEVLKDLVK
jgi:hypothetical protein